MTVAKSILLVDNDQHVLDSVGFNLMRAGYKVLKAKSVEQAHKLLNHEIFHLGIIDIRLEDEKRKADTSGFEVARELRGHVPCMVYTAYEDVYEDTDNVRQVFGEIGAKEFLYKTKQDDPSKLIDVVNKLFRLNVMVNFNLVIESTVSLDEIANQIHGPASDEDLRPTKEDVEQVLQKLFYDASKITIGYLLSAQSAEMVSQTGSVIVQAQPHIAHNQGLAVIVKLGPRDEIIKESKNYQRIKPFIGGQQQAVLEGEAYSRQVGGLIFTPVGADNDLPTRTLREVYLTEDIEVVKDLLKQFFRQTFGPIFADAPREQIDLTAMYTEALDLTPEKLRKAADDHEPGILDKPAISFEGLNRDFRNPIAWALRDDNRFKQFAVYSHVCPYHGTLHSDNILLDDRNRSWLVDFGTVGVGHALYSFVALETDIKFNILAVDNLEVLYYLERALLTPASFSDEPPHLSSNEDQLVRAYQIILALRGLASELIGPKVNIREYYQALFFHTLNVLCSPVAETKKKHALLLAALICQRLEDWPDWDVGSQTDASGKGLSSSYPAANLTPLEDLKKRVSNLFKDAD